MGFGAAVIFGLELIFREKVGSTEQEWGSTKILYFLDSKLH